MFGVVDRGQYPTIEELASLVPVIHEHLNGPYRVLNISKNHALEDEFYVSLDNGQCYQINLREVPEIKLYSTTMF